MPFVRGARTAVLVARHPGPFPVHRFWVPRQEEMRDHALDGPRVPEVHPAHHAHVHDGGHLRRHRRRLLSAMPSATPGLRASTWHTRSCPYPGGGTGLGMGGGVISPSPAARARRSAHSASSASPCSCSWWPRSPSWRCIPCSPSSCAGCWEAKAKRFRRRSAT